MQGLVSNGSFDLVYLTGANTFHIGKGCTLGRSWINEMFNIAETCSRHDLYSQASPKGILTDVCCIINKHTHSL